MGRQIGEAARELVARGLAYYEENFPLLAGITFAEAVERTQPYLAVAERHLPQIMDQLRGVAEGSGLPLERLFAWNCCEELTCVPERPDASAGGRPARPRLPPRALHLVRVRGR